MVAYLIGYRWHRYSKNDENPRNKSGTIIIQKKNMYQDGERVLYNIFSNQTSLHFYGCLKRHDGWIFQELEQKVKSGFFFVKRIWNIYDVCKHIKMFVYIVQGRHGNLARKFL